MGSCPWNRRFRSTARPDARSAAGRGGRDEGPVAGSCSHGADQGQDREGQIGGHAVEWTAQTFAEWLGSL